MSNATNYPQVPQYKPQNIQTQAPVQPQQYSYPPFPLAYPQPFNTTVQSKLVGQTCGTILAVIFAILSICSVCSSLFSLFYSSDPIQIIAILLSALASGFYAYFFIEMVRVPDFLAGNPKYTKFWAPAANFVLCMIRSIMGYFCDSEYEGTEILINTILGEVIIFVCCLAMYYHDDSKASGCLCFKPWIYQYTQQIYYPYPNPLQRIPSPGMMPASPPPSYPMAPFGYPGYNAPVQVPIAQSQPLQSPQQQNFNDNI